MTTPITREDDRSRASYFPRVFYWFCRHWMLVFTLILAIFVGVPWLAPLFMEAGWTGAANAIYLIYSALCHQLPQRSFFLFGEQLMLPLDAVRTLGKDSANPLILRQFIGSADVGWKVAWSDRMVFMYAALFLFGIAFWPLRRHLTPLSWKNFLLFLLPMFLDGFTHMLSDLFGGIGSGFRDSNDWLASLTRNSFPITFYAGDGLGSFNSWMRLITGILFGLGVVWFAYPRLHSAFGRSATQIEPRIRP